MKWAGAIILIALILLILAASGDSPKQGEEWDKIAQPYTFDFVSWEVRNIFDKPIYGLKSVFRDAETTEEDKIRIVERYFSLGQQIRLLEFEIARAGPAEDLTLPEQQLSALRRERSGLEDMVEGFLESQMSGVLAEEGLFTSFGLGWKVGFLLPPLDFEFESPPYILIISPRDRIKLADTIALRQHLSLEEITEIEEQIEGLGLSALVERLGGLGTYPAIVPETSTLEAVLSQIAHEWLHAYFFFRSLGQHYWDSYEMRTINETAADIAGKEIASLVLNYYYQEQGEEAVEAEPALDFSQEMRGIRIRVDQYLEQGQVEEAERFMEQKQQFLASKGYFIRKLNQAYFAFHGAYADTPASVSPIGRELTELRGQSASLGEFVKAAAQISSYTELKEMIGEER